MQVLRQHCAYLSFITEGVPLLEAAVLCPEGSVEERLICRSERINRK